MIEPVVAVDLGNSAIKLCVRQDEASDDSEGRIDHTIRLDQADWDLSAVEWARGRFGSTAIQWRVASVHRSAASRLCRAIAKLQRDAVVFRITRRDVPMRLLVDHPEKLGIDRLVGAHAARLRFGTPLVVVDAGSAVTVDWVNAEGEFAGGAILPGLALQLGSLATGTDALPRIDCSLQATTAIPARNTSQAILLGVLTTVSAGIDRLAARYADEAGLETQDCRLILTGGDASVLAPRLTHPHQVVKNLVCRGLLDLQGSSLLEIAAGEQLE